MKNNYILEHGSFGSLFGNWIPYLRKELNNRNLEVYTPDFPTEIVYQNDENWPKFLKDYLEADIINQKQCLKQRLMKDKILM